MSDYILPHEVDRRLKALSTAIDKIEQDDSEGAMVELAKTQVTAETLSMFKDTRGADWIRKMNFDTTRADERYGEGWLDQ